MTMREKTIKRVNELFDITTNMRGNVYALEIDASFTNGDGDSTGLKFKVYPDEEVALPLAPLKNDSASTDI